jgi:hypothetical protein
MAYHFGISHRLTLLAVLASISVLTLAVLSWSGYHSAKINGPLYQEVVNDKDFLADILPPPAFAMEAALTAWTYAETPPAEREAVRTRLATLRQEFDTRWAIWQQLMPTMPLLKLAAEKAFTSGVAVFAAIDGQVVEPVDAGEPDRARQAMPGVVMVIESLPMAELLGRASSLFETPSPSKSAAVSLRFGFSPFAIS